MIRNTTATESQLINHGYKPLLDREMAISIMQRQYNISNPEVVWLYHVFYYLVLQTVSGTWVDLYCCPIDQADPTYVDVGTL